jgi:two-component system, chemotaxis family, CheB/CheR fusion protein
MPNDRIRQLEEQLEALQAKVAAAERLHRRAETLLAGMQHRTRNLLASVRSLAAYTAEHAESVAEFTEHFDGRLTALARCQGIIMRSGDEGADLEELLREEFLSHAVDQSEQITLSGEGVRLGPRVAEAIGLALHELTTNALKYGALANDAGELAISWIKFDGSVAIDWAETGAPAPVRARREGFGRELIERGLPFQLGAHTTLEFKPTGVHCRITAKVSDSAIGRPA